MDVLLGLFVAVSLGQRLTERVRANKIIQLWTLAELFGERTRWSRGGVGGGGDGGITGRGSRRLESDTRRHVRILQRRGGRGPARPAECEPGGHQL